MPETVTVLSQATYDAYLIWLEKGRRMNKRHHREHRAQPPVGVDFRAHHDALRAQHLAERADYFAACPCDLASSAEKIMVPRTLRPPGYPQRETDW